MDFDNIAPARRSSQGRDVGVATKTGRHTRELKRSRADSSGYEGCVGMWEGQRIAVVVPAFDEELHIAAMLGGLPGWVDDVVVVDDGSRDRTAAIAEAVGEPIRVIRHRANRGVGAALISGYGAALESGADIVAVMAGDGQMCPDELESLVAAVGRGHCDYAKGDRTGHPAVRQRMPLWRRLGNRVLSTWTQRISGGQPLRDAQCGYTAVSASALQRIPLERLYPRYGYPNDLLVMLGTVGPDRRAAGDTIYEGQASPGSGRSARVHRTATCWLGPGGGGGRLAARGARSLAAARERRGG
ncbi:MAG: glycosyltransferase family 2 protein [Myxococcota bacterium]